MIKLRETGHSLPEIKRLMKRGYGSVYSHIKDVPILPGHRSSWEIKRGGNKRRSTERWEQARQIALKDIPKNLSRQEYLLIAACLYWGEGSKAEFGIINSDPRMIKTMVLCLQELGVPKSRMRIGIRIYEDIDRDQAVAFWAKIIEIPEKQITSVNTLRGKKSGKLEFGMCRLRIVKGQDIFKLLQCAIKEITLKIAPL